MSLSQWNDWKVWVKALAAVLIGGAVGGVSDAFSHPESLGNPAAALLGAKRAALTGAILAVCGYLKSNPFPCADCAERTTANGKSV